MTSRDPSGQGRDPDINTRFNISQAVQDVGLQTSSTRMTPVTTLFVSSASDAAECLSSFDDSSSVFGIHNHLMGKDQTPEHRFLYKGSPVRQCRIKTSEALVHSEKCGPLWGRGPGRAYPLLRDGGPGVSPPGKILKFEMRFGAIWCILARN